jgi:hypothetical protein
MLKQYFGIAVTLFRKDQGLLEIVTKCKSYSNKTKRCKMCSHEKFIIIYYPEPCLLNAKHELFLEEKKSIISGR